MKQAVFLLNSVHLFDKINTIIMMDKGDRFMSKLYRKSALEKLASPEQLDRMVVIVSPSVWLAIIAGVILLVTSIAWGLTGSVPVLVSCDGEFYSDVGEIESIYSEVNGFVRECSVQSGENVKENETLVVVEDMQGIRHRIKAKKNAAVYSVMAEEGSYLEIGQKVLQIRELTENESGIIYCYTSLNNARKISKGMEVMVYPNSLNTKEYGHMKGTVTGISRFVLNRGEMEKYIGNEEKISELLSGEYLVGIQCELEKDPESVNGYQWSNEKGKKLELQSGTSVTTEIVIANRSPFNTLFN